MKSCKNNLIKQLLFVVGIAFLLLFISLGAILPRLLIPVAESNIYNYLREPLKIYDNNTEIKIEDTEIAYIYVSNNNIATSYNIKDVIKYDDVKTLISKMDKEYGKLIYNHNIYYYYTIKNDNITKIAITNNNYINRAKTSVLSAIFPLLLGTFLLIGLMLVLWSSVVVRKIEKLKNKIDNIDNPDYNHKINFIIDDEIRSLSLAIEDTHCDSKCTIQMLKNTNESVTILNTQDITLDLNGKTVAGVLPGYTVDNQGTFTLIDKANAYWLYYMKE